MSEPNQEDEVVDLTEALNHAAQLKYDEGFRDGINRAGWTEKHEGFQQ